ncbi:hypothetical protein [Candidatus Magnetomonas plexicatena]|uniref:hypothetical protein n=1 Tax=Candidatus Magnetomonas plexicatena TaxID=2552947 RepID=UPI001C75E3FF|nr:hypothetical protein E2O03_009470 [Nitrospirales bacterium LBB_01]
MHYPIPYPYTNRLNTLLEGYTLSPLKSGLDNGVHYSGTWNDTNEEKAKAFSDNRLYTAVAIWKGASELQFIVYGQNVELGKYLLERVIAVQNTSTRSTQSVGIDKLIKDYNFSVVCPPDKEVDLILQLIVSYNRTLAEYVNKSNIKRIQDFQ